jgi:hypothetical protein
MLVEPRRVLTAKQLACGDVLDDARRPPRGSPLATCNGSFGTVQGFVDRFDVDPRVGG